MSIMNVLTQQCVLCGDSLNRSFGICDPCQQELPTPVNGCQRCGIEMGPEPSACGYCGQCLSDPPAFDRCIALCRYEYPIRELIASFKFHARFAEGQALAKLLAERVLNCYEPDDMPQSLLPVPLHPRRLRERGYNQSVELARAVGRRCNIPIALHYCRRTRSTPSQKGLSADERAVNLRNAFVLDQNGSAKPPRHIAIVDDVVTTMTTVNTIARMLRAAGHSRIDVICLARVS
ncbi:MAG: ComF family protein [Gammaproteobacteria bacterium]|nr:ComF family protein [Gammaproteobacteria bacterium]MDP2139878.1 ComF family protein [Gammaproteobacteria bacterium]MDP2347698.1 ComF family protein [Gammaproteobacteria bacterium]